MPLRLAAAQRKPVRLIQDPGEELVGLVQRAFPDEPSAADRAAATLVRRRFGTALPPPFAAPPAPGSDVPIRTAAPADGPAIAAVKWRSWKVGYRGVVDDDFLDDRAVVHPPWTWWTERARFPPSRQHRLLVLGRPGEVHGFCDAGPYRDAQVDVDGEGDVGQVYSLYVDPGCYRQGRGAALLAAAVEHLHGAGLGDLRLWVVDANQRARSFYAAQGWAPDGASATRAFPDLTVVEVRYRG